MSMPRYAVYKPSGVEWLDSIPEHWSFVALRWIAKRYSGGTPDKSNDTYWEDGDIPWINSGSVNDGYITQPSALITREAFANSSAKWVPKGALVMALAGQGKTKGMVAQVGIETTCNQSMAAIIPNQRCQSRYLYWWLIANYQNIRNMAGGEARDGLNLDMLGSIPCPLPPLEEQQTIARFLDAQTAKLDTLVAKKRALIDKLKEKRSALIARTVTRGLPAASTRAASTMNLKTPVIPAKAGIQQDEAGGKGKLEPHPAMKDSGVEWLGKIPAHWKIPPLYSRYSVELGKMLNESRITGQHLVTYLRNIDVQWDNINFEDLPEMDITEAEYQRYTVKLGDLLVCEGGEVGRAAIVGEFAGVIGYQKALHRLRTTNSAELPRFMYYILLWAANTGVFNAGGMSTIAHLTGEQLRKYRFPKPPLPEQQAIADYLDRETARIDQLVAKVEAAIERLTEYRQALITAAVTGKIDVRTRTVG